jgi:hypothetical protein
MGGLRGEGEGEVENENEVENEVENEGKGEAVIKRGAAPQLFVVRSSVYICIRPVEDCGIPSEAARRKLG